jgi:Subtilase family
MIRVNIVPHQFLLPDSTIEIESDTPLAERAASAGISVVEVGGKVRLARGGRRAVWMSDKRLAPGHYTLHVRDLVDERGKLIVERHVVPFTVIDTKARVGPSVRVESFVRAQVENDRLARLSPIAAARGRYVELVKGTDQRTGRPVEVAFDNNGRRINATELLSKLAAARVKRLGKYDEALYRYLARAGASARIKVAVWLRYEESLPRKATRARPRSQQQTRTLAERNVRRRAAVANTVQRFLASSPGPLLRAAERAAHAPVLFARLTKAELRELQADERVVGIFLAPVKPVDDLANSLKVSGADTVISAGTKGSGVRVAVWEQGPDSTTNLTISGFFDTTQSAMSSHARMTNGIIKNKEANKPKGYAPSCRLFSANSYDRAALDWAVGQRNCTVISQSFHDDAEQTSDSLSFMDIYKDWLALRSPYPTIVMASGNGTSTEYVNHKSFNTLTVGNHDDTAAAMSGSTVFRNPASPHSDRELPEICANGTGVSVAGLTDSGTSFAAPAVAGSVALVQGVDTILQIWPEGCRAILLAAADKNITGSTWWKDVSTGTDARDGAGSLDAQQAVAITRARRGRNNSGHALGWDIGYFEDGLFGTDRMSTFVYRITVPTIRLQFFTRPRVKVALAWNSAVTTINFPLTTFELPISSVLTHDYDLMVFDANGGLVGYSGSYDNSYEVAEFNAVGGATYTVKIRRWAGSGDMPYGIAWSTRSDFRLSSVLLSEVLQIEGH